MDVASRLASSGVRAAEAPADAFGPGLVAFLIVALLAVATALLMWSMVRQIRKVPADLDTPTGRRPAKPPSAPDAAPDAAPSAAPNAAKDTAPGADGSGDD